MAGIPARTFYAAFFGMVALAVSLWRPFLFGFYYDDWTVMGEGAWTGAFFSAERLWFFWQQYHPRPGLIPLYWLGSGLFGDNAFAWQWFSLLLQAGVALSLGSLCARMVAWQEEEQETRWLVVASVAAAWMAFPWLLGFHAWVTSSVNGAALIAFAWAMAVMFRYPAATVRYYLLGFVLLLCSLLSYEAVYFQFGVFLLLVWLQPDRMPRRYVYRWALVFGGAQLLAIIWNRVQLLFPSSFNKHFNADWLGTFYHFYSQAWEILSQSFLEYRVVIAVGAIAVVMMIVRLADKAQRVRHLLIWCGATIMGIAGAGMLFAMASYGLSSIGESGRTAVMFGFWGALLLGYMVHLARGNHLLLALVCCLLVALSHATWLRGQDYARAWQAQESIMAQWPSFTPTSAEDSFLFYSPHTTPVTIFDAPWMVGSFTGHLYYTRSPAQTPPKGWSGRWMSVGLPEWRVMWDGKTVRQASCDAPEHFLFSMPAHGKLWLWKPGQAAFKAVTRHFDSGCGRPFPDEAA